MDRQPDDPWREIHKRGDADIALAFGHLFWPVLVERRGCVLVEHRADDDAIARGVEDCDGDLQRVAATLNRVQIRSEMLTEDSPREDEVPGPIHTRDPAAAAWRSQSPDGEAGA